MEDSVQDYNHIGEELFQTGDYRGAEDAFSKILRLDPHNAEAYNNLGVIAFLRRDTAKAIDYFTRSLSIDPFYQDALLNFTDLLRSLNLLHEAVPYLEAAIARHPHRNQLQDLLQEARAAFKNVVKPKGVPWKLYYSPGIALHGENARRLLGLEHYIPALHCNDPVWFFGLYFDYDYLILQAHQGNKIINWRGADTLRMLQKPERVKCIQGLEALHVCQALHQKDLLQQMGIKAIVRPMLNRSFEDIQLVPLPAGQTRILVYWRSGDDEYIRADLFFEIAARCPEVIFHIVGKEDANRFNKPGLENLVFHGFLSENDLDQLMDQCKGTIRPWIWDGNPNIQTRMLLKGRYAAHSCRFEKVAQCETIEDYVRWIRQLQQIEQSNVEAREWWLDHLNRFDFLQADFTPDKAK
jgi:glycosyltransferase involved in cell wall biosynthesis